MTQNELQAATLHLVLKSYWYDLIASGEKTEEYREIKPYWEKRLLDYKRLSDYVDKNYKAMLLYDFIVHGSFNPHIDDAPHMFPRGYKKVIFRRGYHKDAPKMAFVINDICIGKGKIKWGAPTDQEVFIIKLGERII